MDTPPKAIVLAASAAFLPVNDPATMAGSIVFARFLDGRSRSRGAHGRLRKLQRVMHCGFVLQPLRTPLWVGARRDAQPRRAELEQLVPGCLFEPMRDQLGRIDDLGKKIHDQRLTWRLRQSR
ncbi:hypothetical protein [Cupriavidus necator]|uniref:hypothetical protein n=1 Tax=Cupriavidus necator TaxID=106590 RepID=UPI0012D2ECF8|nr:hypothetical protein [Cupriavidus necator]